MRIVIRLFIVLLLLLAIVFGTQQYAAESGEVVVLTAPDPSGEPQQTRLWIVDHEGAQWLRAGYSGSGWLARLNAANSVTVERNGETMVYGTAIEPEATPAINAAMAQKYGWADSYIGTLFGGREDSVAIRLIPEPSL